MVFPVIGANTASAEDLITNSSRFDNNANYLYADRFGTPSNADKYTISFWFKIGSRNNVDQLINYNYGNNNRGFVITLRNDASLRWEEFTAAVATYSDIKTNRLFRDSSAWYHIVVAYDSTQGTASNRAKLYINGVQETSLATATYPDQNFDGFLGTTPNNNKGFIIGAYYNGQGNIDSANYTDGYMAHFYLIDGTAYAASDFGETNDNGVWIPKDAKGDLTFGTNGFFLEFKETGTSANASGIGADTSGNDNHFSVSGFSAIDITTDTPSNNFATYNPVDTSSNITLTEGNTLATANSNHSASRATIGVRNGKWYWENKIVSDSGGPAVGIMAANAPLGDQLNSTPSRFYRDSGQKITDGTASNYGNTYTTNDIIGVALDLDNGAIYFYKNGTIENSGTAAFTDLLTATTEHWLPAVKLYNEAISINFGNPSYSISSSNSDANGYGSFEYAVPSGYYSLCTKNLAEYG